MRTTAERLVSTREIAERLGRSSKPIRQWVAEGRFPKPIKGGKCWFFRPDVIEAWFARQEAEAPV